MLQMLGLENHAGHGQQNIFGRTGISGTRLTYQTEGLLQSVTADDAAVVVVEVAACSLSYCLSP